MSEPISGSAFGDWEAVMAEALASTGGPLTADEREWAASTFGLTFDTGPAVDADTTLRIDTAPSPDAEATAAEGDRDDQ